MTELILDYTFKNGIKCTTKVVGGSKMELKIRFHVDNINLYQEEIREEFDNEYADYLYQSIADFYLINVTSINAYTLEETIYEPSITLMN